MYLFIVLVITIFLIIAIKNLFLNTPTICNEFSENYKYICLQLNAQKLAVNDFNGAWKICKQINQDSLRDECYNNIVVEIGKEKPEEAHQHCGGINSEKWRGECYFNMALFLIKNNITKAFAMCDKAEIYIPFCYHDVAGEVSLINPTIALNICEKQTDNLIRRTCFHGIGKYLGRSEPDKAIIYCNQIKHIGYKETCYHGMGWGVSEITNSSEAILYCKKIKSGFTGNCLVGVAWQLSYNRSKLAKNVCQMITNKNLRTDCLSYILKDEKI